METYKEHITDEDKQFFEEKIAVLKDMQKDGDYTGFDGIAEEVENRWHTISSKAYGGSNSQNFDAESQFGKWFGGQNNPFGGTTTGQNQQTDDNVDVQDAK